MLKSQNIFRRMGRILAGGRSKGFASKDTARRQFCMGPGVNFSASGSKPQAGEMTKFWLNLAQILAKFG